MRLSQPLHRVDSVSRYLLVAREVYQMRFALACTLLVILSAAPALAQFDSATVVGTVRDASGAVVPWKGRK